MVGRAADEILILRRFSGYLRLHVPALVYSAKASYLLERALSAVDGVRKVGIKKELGKLSIYYDSILTPEREILLAVDLVATPLLKSDQQEVYEKTMVQVEDARRRMLARKAVVVVIVWYLVDIHWTLIRRWVRNPIRHWPKLLTIVVLIYLHRKQLKGAVSLE